MDIIFLLLILATTSVVIYLMVIVISRSNFRNSFGEYQLNNIIGKGGMATIYKAKSKILKRMVAVKLLDQVLMSDKDLAYKFLMEGESIEKINNKHPDAPLVKVLEYGKYKINGIKSYFIAMDLLDGVDLLKIIKGSKKLDIRSKIYIIKETARALDASHSLKIYHRDISPDNVIVNGKDVRLIDFGIAKQEFSDYRTLDGAIAGKPYYMSPEQCSGGIVNDKSDIYSLGAVFYYLLTEKNMYDSKNPIEIMSMHQKKPVPELKIDINSEVKSLLKKMLNKDPEKRPGAGDIVNILNNYLKSN